MQGESGRASERPDEKSTDEASAPGPLIGPGHLGLVAAALVASTEPMTADEIGEGIIGIDVPRYVHDVVDASLAQLLRTGEITSVPGEPSTRYAPSPAFALLVRDATPLASDVAVAIMGDAFATVDTYAPPEDEDDDLAETATEPAPPAPFVPENIPGPTMSNQNTETAELVDVPAMRPTPATPTGSRVLRADETAEIEATVASVRASLQALRDRKARESRARIEAEVLRQIDAQVKELLAEGIPMEEIEAALAEGGFTPAGA